MGILEYNSHIVEEKKPYIIFENIQKKSYDTSNIKITTELYFASKENTPEFNVIKNKKAENTEEEKFNLDIQKINGNKSKKSKELNNPKKTKHTKFSNDNARNNIYRSCMDSIWISLGEICKEKDITLDLEKPFITYQFKHSYADNQNFFKKTVEDISANHIPRRISDEKQYNRDLYKPESKAKVEKFLQKQQEGMDIINKLIKLPFEVYLIAYLNDKKIITIKDENGIEREQVLIGFKTLKDCFIDENTKEEIYTREQKDTYKNHIYYIMGKK